MTNHLPPIWGAIVAECERRANGWAKAIDGAGHGDDRWRKSDQRNADLAKWHVIAVRIARKTGVSTFDLEELIGFGRPTQPNTAQGWLDLLAMVRRAVDREAPNGETDTWRNLYAIWRWLHIYVHVWRLPALDRAPHPQTKRSAA